MHESARDMDKSQFDKEIKEIDRNSTQNSLPKMETFRLTKSNSPTKLPSPKR